MVLFFDVYIPLFPLHDGIFEAMACMVICLLLASLNYGRYSTLLLLFEFVSQDVRWGLRTDFMMPNGIKCAIAEHAGKTKKLDTGARIRTLARIFPYYRCLFAS